MLAQFPTQTYDLSNITITVQLMEAFAECQRDGSAKKPDGDRNAIRPSSLGASRGKTRPHADRNILGEWDEYLNQQQHRNRLNQLTIWPDRSAGQFGRHVLSYRGIEQSGDAEPIH